MNTAWSGALKVEGKQTNIRKKNLIDETITEYLRFSHILSYTEGNRVCTWKSLSAIVSSSRVYRSKGSAYIICSLILTSLIYALPTSFPYVFLTCSLRKTSDSCQNWRWFSWTLSHDEVLLNHCLNGMFVCFLVLKLSEKLKYLSPVTIERVR